MDIIGNDDELGKNAPEITPFLDAFISMVKTKLDNTPHMSAYLSFQLKSAPEGAAVVELDKRVMDTAKSKAVLAQTIRSLRTQHGDDMESLALCMDSWVNSRNTPDEYNELLLKRVLRVEDLPACYKLEALAIRYMCRPAYKASESWLGQFAYRRHDNQINWMPPLWVRIDAPDVTFGGIFSDL